MNQNLQHGEDVESPSKTIPMSWWKLEIFLASLQEWWIAKKKIKQQCNDKSCASKMKSMNDN